MNRSEWVDAETWRDPDCVECGGEGAPCCEPPAPDAPRPAEAVPTPGERRTQFGSVHEWTGSVWRHVPHSELDRDAWRRSRG